MIIQLAPVWQFLHRNEAKIDNHVLKYNFALLNQHLNNVVVNNEIIFGTTIKWFRSIKKKNTILFRTDNWFEIQLTIISLQVPKINYCSIPFVNLLILQSSMSEIFEAINQSNQNYNNPTCLSDDRKSIKKNKENRMWPNSEWNHSNKIYCHRSVGYFVWNSKSANSYEKKKNSSA